MQKLETLKTELREFIELSKTITTRKWDIHHPVIDNIFQAHFIVSSPTDAAYAPVAKCQSRTMNLSEARANATFISRCRNISPAMAECLLATIEGLENTHIIGVKAVL